MAEQPKRVNSWVSFTRRIGDLALDACTEPCYCFRGHSDASWDLRPSLTRRMRGASAEEIRDIEIALLHEFSSQAHAEVPAYTRGPHAPPTSWWYYMQHYRAPTRLLDWTESPYVAAYFAVEDTAYWDRDGAIWMFDAGQLSEGMDKMYPEVTREKDRARNLDRFTKKQVFNPDAPALLMCVWNRYKDARMIAQRGLFTLCLQPQHDHSEILGRALPDGPIKLVIPMRQKSEFLRHLRAINIGAHSLFPGMDGIGRSLSEWVLLHRNPRR